jgi:DNA polymerase zeta
MTLSYQRNPHDSKANTYVARITLCKGVPIYGFHVGWSFFLKIYMLNPGHMQRLADLLRSGNIMGRKMQPYEVHIPYLLQFMSDYGLYGCGWVECRTVTFRAPVPAEDETVFEQSWNESTIPQHLITSTDDKPRLSHCAVEIDLLSHNILNRRTIKPRLLHHDFVERTNPIPLSEKLVHSMAELWRDDERRRAQKGDERSTPSHFTSASDETWHKGPWIHESELRQQLENLIQTERNKSDMHTLSFDTFVKPTRFESMVQTALESVTDMFPPELPSSSQKRDNYVGVHTSSGHVREDSNDFPSPEVDEHLASELSEANIENISGQGSVNGEEYYSDRTEESASDIDFDGDALDNGEHITLSTIFERGVSFSGQHNALSDLDSLDLSELSDDIDLDHDMGSPSRRTSANFGPSFSSENIIRELTDARDLKSSSRSNGRPQEPLRLRGGASTQKRKQSSLDKSAKDESHKRLRVKNNSVNSNEIESVVLIPKDRKVTFSSPNPSFPFSSEELQDLENPKATTDEATDPKRASMNRYPSAETRNWIAPRKRYSWKFPPPHTRSLLSSLHKWNVPRVIPQSAFYSKDEDVPSIIREYAGREFKLVSKSLPHLERFHGGHDFTASIVKDSPEISSLVLNSTTKIWQFQYRAPLRSKLGTAYSLGPGKLRRNFAEGEDDGMGFFADGQVMQSKSRNISQV